MANNGTLLTLGAIGLLAATSEVRRRRGSSFREKEPDIDADTPIFDLNKLLRGEEDEEPAPPEECDVFLLNDATVEGFFVVDMLHEVFGLGQDQATGVMMHAHQHGQGLIVTTSCERANELAAQARRYGRDHDYPQVGLSVVDHD